MRWCLGVLGLGVLVACASGPAPAAKDGSAATESADQASSDDAADNPPLRAQREAFMQSCMQTAESPDYCECGFEQFRIIFKDVDLSHKLPPDDPHLERLREQTLDVCASKLREEQVQTNFVEGCIDGNEKKRAYCTCAWPALRKNLSVPDFVLADLEGERFFEAKKSMVLACKGKFPAEVARSDFMAACTKDTSAKTCDCFWKKLKAKFTMEELAAGTADISSAPGLSECHGKPLKGAENRLGAEAETLAYAD